MDTEAKLRNLRRTEERLLEHLNRTGKLSDILLVERELNRVRGEIDLLEGKLRFLQHRIAFSTLSITLQGEARSQPTVPPQSFSTGKVASDAARTLVAFAQWIWSIVIWVGVWSALWVPLTFLIWVAHRRGQARKARQGTPEEG